jgi:hypothetical protein
MPQSFIPEHFYGKGYKPAKKTPLFTTAKQGRIYLSQALDEK